MRKLEIIARWASLNPNDTNGKIMTLCKSNVPTEVIEQALADPVNAVREYAAGTNRITSAQLDKALKDPYIGVVRAAASNKNLTPMQMAVAMNHNDQGVQETLLRNKHLTPNFLEMFVDCSLRDGRDYRRDFNLLDHPNLTPEQLTKLWKTSNQTDLYVQCNVVRHKNLPVEIMREAMASNHTSMRQAVVKNKSAPPEIIEIGLFDRSVSVRRWAIKSKHVTPAQLLRVVSKDRSTSLKENALNHPSFRLDPKFLMRVSLTAKSKRLKKTILQRLRMSVRNELPYE